MPPARGLIGSGRHCLVASDARERNIVFITLLLPFLRMNERTANGSSDLAVAGLQVAPRCGARIC